MHLVIPSSLQQLLVGATLEHSQPGRLGSQVYRFHRSDGTKFYVKAGEGYAAKDLDAERERLQWLDGKLPVPKIYAYDARENSFVLVLSEVPGIGSDSSSE